MERDGLRIDESLVSLVVDEVLPGTGIDPDRFWSGLAAFLRDLTPRNRELLRVRDEMQERLDAWHGAHAGRAVDLNAYKAFLRDIGYLAPDPGEVTISTANVDAEISEIAGPQLVVPVSNARYALNAANARWGSLYDALYGTDAIPVESGTAADGGLDKTRARAVIAAAKAFLDEIARLGEGSHCEVTAYSLKGSSLVARRSNGRSTRLRDNNILAGYSGKPEAPDAVLLQHNGLHVEIG